MGFFYVIYALGMFVGTLMVLYSLRILYTYSIYIINNGFYGSYLSNNTLYSFFFAMALLQVISLLRIYYLTVVTVFLIWFLYYCICSLHSHGCTLFLLLFLY